MGDAKTRISTDLQLNIDRYQRLFADCADIKMRRMALGQNKSRECFIAYIEVSVSNMLLETTALGRALAYLGEAPDEEVNSVLDKNAMGISDVTPFLYVEDAAQGMLTGDAILFVDGYDKALKIADKGYPGAAIKEPDSEKSIRGSREGFTDSIKMNTALIRKRLRSTRVRVKELEQGVRSHTKVDMVYMQDLANPMVLEEIQKRLEAYEIDGVLDSGVIDSPVLGKIPPVAGPGGACGNGGARGGAVGQFPGSTHSSD